MIRLCRLQFDGASKNCDRVRVTGAKLGQITTMASDARLPKIDFSDVDPADRGSAAWAAARQQVAEALTSLGCFEAIYDRVTPQLRDAVLRAVAEELFPLPLETKLKNASERTFGGYMGQIPGRAFESLAIAGASLARCAPAFAALLWPDDGNPSFSETMYAFGSLVAQLEEMVRRMVLESMGLVKYHDQQSESLEYVFRFNKYGDEEENEGEKKVAGYEAHRDTNTLGIVCQLNGVDGLDVENGEGGEWIRAKPSSAASFFVFAGDAFRAWSNGTVRAARHRIDLGEKKAIRYSTALFSCPKDEQVVQAPPELVDDSHPVLFKPYTYGGFLRFVGSVESANAECKLTAYCGVGVATN